MTQKKEKSEILKTREAELKALNVKVKDLPKGLEALSDEDYKKLIEDLKAEIEKAEANYNRFIELKHSEIRIKDNVNSPSKLPDDLKKELEILKDIVSKYDGPIATMNKTISCPNGYLLKTVEGFPVPQFLADKLPAAAQARANYFKK